MKKHISIINLLTIISLTFLSSGCAMMIPDGNGFFADLSQEESSPGFFSPGKSFPVMTGDDGESSGNYRSLASQDNTYRQELLRKENNLNYYELDRYKKDAKYLENDSDKIYYLSLDLADRERYIESRKEESLEKEDFRGNSLIKRSVHSNELYIGMNKNEVVGIWGKPAKVEIAGHPSYQNERWSFIEDGSLKQVYFEGGRVHGWALDL